MNRKLNAKWLGIERIEKEKKLFLKAGDKNKSKLEGFLTQADNIRKEIKALEKNNSASIKLNIIAEQIVDSAERKERVDKILNYLNADEIDSTTNLPTGKKKKFINMK